MKHRVTGRLATDLGPRVFISKRSERKGTMECSLSRASAGNVRLHTALLGAAQEAKHPGSTPCPEVGIPFISYVMC